jgi:uncharacterized protein (DUF1330 family)
MSAYLVATLDIQAQSWLESYVPPVEKLVEKHGGRYLTRAFEFDQMEGESRPDVVVVLEFPSMDSARAFYEDPEYQPHLKKRIAGCSGGLFLVPGE